MQESFSINYAKFQNLKSNVFDTYVDADITFPNYMNDPDSNCIFYMKLAYNISQSSHSMKIDRL